MTAAKTPPNTSPALEKIAALIAADLVLNMIPVEHLEPLLGEPGSGTIASCAARISERIMSGALNPAFATAFTARVIQGAQDQRGCQERCGTKELLEILVQSCPAGVPSGEKTRTIRRVLDAYQGPCCGQTPCIRGKAQSVE